MSGTVLNPKKQIPAVGTSSVEVPTGSPIFHPGDPVKILSSSAKLVGIDDILNGVYGFSKTHTGVVGESGLSIGVSGDGPGIGVWGNSETGDGVVGNGRRGVVGESKTFQGVFGKSTDNAGVVGESQNLHGVFGICHNPNGGGVFGTNNAGGFGLIGASDSGTGVSGTGGGFGVIGVSAWLPDRLIELLWTEQHPGTPVQLQLPLTDPGDEPSSATGPHSKRAIRAATATPAHSCSVRYPDARIVLSAT